MFSSSITKLRELRRDGMESRQQRKSSSSSSSKGPRLERRYAAKNIDYEAAAVGESAPGRSRSLDLSPDYASRTSFRIEGVEGVDRLCRTLGLSGPEDFAIPTAAWEARKARSSSDLLPRSRLLASSPDTPPAPTAAPPENASPGRLGESEEDSEPPSRIGEGEDPKSPTNTGREGDGGVGIKGVRPPPVLPLRPPAASSVRTPPPAMPLRPLDDESSAWNILKSFAPELEVAAERGARRSIDLKYGEEYEERDVEEELRVGETAVILTDSTSFSNDDDASSSTTESMFVSPNGRFKRMIKSWQRGSLIGSGSFGTVYEAISDDGFFFAIKEVSLLDQGSNAKQCILQLEQEIALLSQFEHENIVQYFGSEKEEAKLYIFLELVTQGSLASLYQKYHLRDSQVRAYTRQILNGLSYLHDRNVVHRDIKCANILVDATGSVKLADFGLAKEVTILNMLKSCKGSVYWMAPEVVNPKRTYGSAADIWSLGCTVLEMLTRQIPYPNLEWTQAIFRIGRGEPPSIPNSLSRDARDFICQCVQVNADDRPSAAELLEHPFVKRPLSVSSGSDGSSHHNDRRS